MRQTYDLYRPGCLGENKTFNIKKNKTTKKKKTVLHVKVGLQAMHD